MTAILIGEYDLPDSDGFEYHETEYIWKIFETELTWLFENIAKNRFCLTKESYSDSHCSVVRIFVNFYHNEDAVLYRLSF